MGHIDECVERPSDVQNTLASRGSKLILVQAIRHPSVAASGIVPIKAICQFHSLTHSAPLHTNPTVPARVAANSCGGRGNPRWRVGLVF